MSNPETNSIAWAIFHGKEAAKQIRSLRSASNVSWGNGYRNARKLYTFFSKASWSHGAALRAMSSIKKLGNPKPYYITRDGDSGIIWVLSATGSLGKGAPDYVPFKNVGRRGKIQYAFNDSRFNYYLRRTESQYA